MDTGKAFRIYGIVLLFTIITMLFVMTCQVSAVNPKYNRVARLGTPVIDGNLNDPVWEKADWQEMDVYAGGTQPKGFAARSAVLWDDNFFYAAIDVDDAEHAVPKAVAPGADTIWNGDSVQHRVDLEYDSITNSSDDIEWGYALQDGKVMTFAWSGSANIDFDNVKIIRNDAKKKTYYEAALVIRMIKSKQTLSKYVKENPDTEIGYSDMVNANDGGARLGWLEWSSGIGASKDANQFGTLTFDSKPLSVSPLNKLALTWGGIK